MTIKIANLDFELIFLSEEKLKAKWLIITGEKYKEKMWGFIDQVEQKVYLEKGMNNDRIIKTILHEIAHCYNYEYGFGLNHLEIHLIGNLLFEFIKNNWQLINQYIGGKNG